MSVRAATLADVDALVTMGAHFLTQTEYAGRLAVDRDQIRRFVTQCVANALGGESVVLVQDRDGQVVGMIGVLLSAHPFSGERVAGDLFWWVEPGARGSGLDLLRAAETWARTHGATRMQLVAPNDRVARVYLARGYDHLESTYQRSL